MAIDFVEEGGIVRAAPRGTLSGEVLHALLTQLNELLEGRASWPDNLLDLRAVDLSALGFGDLMSIAKRRASIMPPNPIRTAIIADSPAVLGFARMYQSINDNPHITVQIFSDPAEAETWLRSR